MKEDTYLDFLRYCIDETQNLPISANSIDWMAMMAWAESQAIVGVIYSGITDVRSQGENGKSKLQIPFDDLMEWIGYAQDIENRNKLVNERCIEIASEFQKDGFETCILKGQGNAVLYDGRGKREDGRCMALLRTPGDIDVWVMPKSDVRCKKEDVKSPLVRNYTKSDSKFIKEIIRYVRKRNPGAKAIYHHVEYGDFKDVEVEVHYRPSYMFNPVHNYRLQRWFSKMADGGCLMAELPEGVGTITIPNRDFNIIFQLSHIYNHLLHEGIGLRQMIDYYYLLKSDGRSQMDDVGKTLKYLNLYKFAGAVMYIMKEVLGLDEKYLIAPVDERRGKTLLEEIMKGGNFGQSDVENQKATTAVKKNILRIKRDLRMMRDFPSECLWEPVFRLYHWMWRLRYH